MNKKSGARWMVVDNDAAALSTIAHLLSEFSDAEICSYRSAWQALDAFTADPQSFDLVVTDLEMPGMNGVDLRRHIQSVSPSAKVLLTTGSGRFTRETALQNGFCELLNKPFSLGALKQTLETVKAPAANFSKIHL